MWKKPGFSPFFGVDHASRVMVPLALKDELVFRCGGKAARKKYGKKEFAGGNQML
jgi:hypothetical protein